jgi:hypothetical protein
MGVGRLFVGALRSERTHWLGRRSGLAWRSPYVGDGILSIELHSYLDSHVRMGDGQGM